MNKNKIRKHFPGVEIGSSKAFQCMFKSSYSKKDIKNLRSGNVKEYGIKNL